MNVNTPCRESISSETISAWGDGGLSAADAEHLRIHVPTCAACQATASDYRHLDTLMRRQRVPVAPPTDVAAILASQAGETQARQGTTPVRRPARARLAPRAVWGRIGAVAVAAVLIIAFAQVFTHLRPVTPVATVTPTATVGPTPTVIPTSAFRQISAIPGASLGMTPGFIVVSPVNGRNLWVCVPGSQATYAIWRSQDEGASWRQVSTLHSPMPTTFTNSPTDCNIRPDQNDATALSVSFGWSDASQSGRLAYYSHDGGATWTTVPDMELVNVITGGSVSYAIAILETPAGTTALIASADFFATWHLIKTPLQLPGPSITHVFAASIPGELIITGGGGEAYHSMDGGVTWTRVPAPKPEPVATGYVIPGVDVAIWRGQASSWLLCAVDEGWPPARGWCSSSLGNVWTGIPLVTSTFECSSCDGGLSSGAENCLNPALTRDATLYLTCGNDPKDTSNPSVSKLMRLDPKAQAWTTVTTMPCTFSAKVTFAQSGQLWCEDGYKSAYVLDSLP